MRESGRAGYRASKRFLRFSQRMCSSFRQNSTSAAASIALIISTPHESQTYEPTAITGGYAETAYRRLRFLVADVSRAMFRGESNFNGADAGCQIPQLATGAQ